MSDDTDSLRRWTIHGERSIADTRHVRISQADVELPDGTRFTQYVFRMPRCVMTAVLDDLGQRILLIRRHRFIVGEWVWEVPGGYAGEDEDGLVAAAREAEEETGWRPRNLRYLLTYQPMIGNADAPQDLFLASGADLIAEPQTDETATVRWFGLADAAGMIASGQIIGAASIIAVQHAMLRQAGYA